MVGEKKKKKREVNHTVGLPIEGRLKPAQYVCHILIIYSLTFRKLRYCQEVTLYKLHQSSLFNLQVLI